VFRVQGLGFRVKRSGFRVRRLLGSECTVLRSESRVRVAGL